MSRAIPPEEEAWKCHLLVGHLVVPKKIGASFQGRGESVLTVVVSTRRFLPLNSSGHIHKSSWPSPFNLLSHFVLTVVSLSFL